MFVSFYVKSMHVSLAHCSSVHANVGFWFGVGKYDLCGVANLNGVGDKAQNIKFSENALLL